MIKKTQKYVDFDGNERTEDFLFHLTPEECVTMEVNAKGGLKGLISEIINEHDRGRLYGLFKELICKAYGKKSADGRTFTKSPEILADFQSTQAFSDIIMELLTNTDAAIEFVRKVIPDGDKVSEEDIKKQIPNVSSLI